MKFWKKELGEETRKNIKLEEKLNAVENLSEISLPPLVQAPIGKKNSPTNIVGETVATKADETLCSTCAVSGVNFTPEFFLGEQFSPACDDCKSSEENFADENDEDVNKPNSQDDTITNEFEEFLENFKSDEKTWKYEVLVRQMISSGENILDASIPDIKRYNLNLWKSIDSDYRKAFPSLCKSLRNFIKTKFETDPASKNFLVRIIM